MSNIEVSNIEYLVPSVDKQIGKLSFSVSLPILFNKDHKQLAEADTSVELSEATVAMLEQLSVLIIKDLEK